MLLSMTDRDTESFESCASDRSSVSHHRSLAGTAPLTERSLAHPSTQATAALTHGPICFEESSHEGCPGQVPPQISGRDGRCSENGSGPGARHCDDGPWNVADTLDATGNATKCSLSVFGNGMSHSIAPVTKNLTTRCRSRAAQSPNLQSW